MRKFLKLILALILLPVVFFMFVETSHILLRVLGSFRSGWTFWLGAAVYVTVHYTVYNFSRMYVFMHEMTHALAALLCGGRVADISVRKNTGYVKMDKSNVFIALAPYFVPGYVLITAFLYMTGDLFANVTPLRPVFLFLVGFFTAFHFIQTFKTLSEARQPDLKLAGGTVFSIVLILLANLLVLALVLKGIFPGEVSLQQAALRTLKGTLNMGRILVNYIGALLLRE